METSYKVTLPMFFDIVSIILYKEIIHRGIWNSLIKMSNTQIGKSTFKCRKDLKHPKNTKYNFFILKNFFDSLMIISL